MPEPGVHDIMPKIALCGCLRFLLLGGVALLLATGCPRRNDAPESTTGDDRATRSDSKDVAKANDPAGAGDQSSVDALLALPYVGWVEDDDSSEEGLVQWDPEHFYPGYTLYSAAWLGKAVLVDEAGSVVHTWQAPGTRFWTRVKLLPNGDVLTTGADDTKPQPGVASERYALRMNWDSRIIWKKYLWTTHHITTTPNGLLMTLTFSRRQIPEVHPKVPVRDNHVTILSQDGEVIDSLSLYDTVVASPDIFPLISRRPEIVKELKERYWWVDLFHCNSVEWMYHSHLFDKDPIYGPDNVLVCSRHQDRIAILDMKKKELVWAWGQDELSGPHDAQVLTNGNILLLDNGVASRSSRAVEMNPLTGEIVWEFKAPDPQDFFTLRRGSVQRLANGNTLICNADNGEIFEVAPEGSVVWRYLCPDRNRAGKRAIVLHARRYETELIDGLIARWDNDAGVGGVSSSRREPLPASRLARRRGR